MFEVIMIGVLLAFLALLAWLIFPSPDDDYIKHYYDYEDGTDKKDDIVE